MLVTIVGPNLNEVKGTFVVHEAGCGDLTKLRKKYGAHTDTWFDDVEVDSMRAAAEFVYPVGEFDWDDPDAYIDDLWFAPCVQQQLTRNDPSG